MTESGKNVTTGRNMLTFGWKYGQHEKIIHYFHQGYTYKEIIACLLGIDRVHIRRTVSQLQHIIDPEGVENLRARRLRRRKYISSGPNHIWHLDGYDKLKRYGFCIHGCIDGYSRKILWVEVAGTNNCPESVAYYYMKYVGEIGGTSKVVRADRGTENVNIAALQRFFRINGSDSMAGEKSFQFGRSTANQRIKAWWSQLRRTNSQWWMNYFHDMMDDGSWDETDTVQRECLKFCFNDVLQKELHEVQKLHNCHRIRPYPNQQCPRGKPNIIYNIPQAFGTMDQKIHVTQQQRHASLPYVKTKKVFTCSLEFERLALRLMVQNNLRNPRSVLESRKLYDDLLSLIQQI